MEKDVINTIILSVAFLILFAIAETLYHVFKVKAEITRKLIHVSAGLLILLFPVMIGNQWLVLAMCFGFMVILILSLKFNMIKSINAIDRTSYGTVAYAISVYCCYLVYNYFDHLYIYFYLPILILAVCDPIAALTGRRWPRGKYKIGKDNKTMTGSSMFFISAFIICLVLFYLLKQEYNYSKIMLQATIIAFFSTVSEAFSRKGYDNIFIPASVLCSFIVSGYFL